MTYIDTNVILRYLLDDDPPLSSEAKALLEDLEEKHTGIEVVLGGIALYGTSSMDFVDAWLVSLHRITGIKILSFDKKVRRLTR